MLFFSLQMRQGLESLHLGFSNRVDANKSAQLRTLSHDRARLVTGITYIILSQKRNNKSADQSARVICMVVLRHCDNTPM